MIAALERVLFANRLAVLTVLAVFTVLMGAFASQIRVAADFERTLPVDHPIIQTYLDFKDRLVGTNRAVAVLATTDGDIYSREYLTQLKGVTQDMAAFARDRELGVTSLWTPNVRLYEITEEGFAGRDLIPGTVSPETIDAAMLETLRADVVRGGFAGRTVGIDHRSSMVMAELLDRDPQTRQPLDAFDLGARLEALRVKYETGPYSLHIVGFPAMVTELKDTAWTWTPVFFAAAFAMTVLSVFLYIRSWRLTTLTVGCSLTSVVWQLGTMAALDLPFDPLTVLIPFLVFAIGVSHGVQQLNAYMRDIFRGDTSEQAARVSFSALFAPGAAAIVTDGIGFATLALIPIPMVQAAALTAAIGVSYKLVSNLVMLPLIASYLKPSPHLGQRARSERVFFHSVGRIVAHVVDPPVARVISLLALALLATAFLQSRDLFLGDRQEGAPELTAQARYNQDTAYISAHYVTGLNIFTVVVTTPAQACVDPATMRYLDEFGWHMRNAPGVTEAVSAASLSKLLASGMNEGNLKQRGIPANSESISQSIFPIPTSAGIFDPDCTLLPLYLFLEDTRAETLSGVIRAAETWQAQRPAPEGVAIRLASGNAGVIAAVNDAISRAEAPLMLILMGTVMFIVLATFRDWRAAICCLVPLVLATVLAWWFMTFMGIGLKVATLPVFAIAVGTGVDYAFYIYALLEKYMGKRHETGHAFHRMLVERGTAVAFTAVTMAASVAIWSVSPLKFQADMGLLMTFMFLANMVLSMTVMPAVAVVLDQLVPPRRAPAPALAPAG